MSELPIYNRLPQTPTLGRPKLLFNVAQYPAKVARSRYVRWLPALLLIPLLLWFFGPHTWRFEHPPPPAIFDHTGLDNKPPALSSSPWTGHGRPYHLNQSASSLWTERAGHVKDAFVHAYDAYMEHAFPADEILPLDGRKIDNFVGWGVTVFDSLDTMWIMGLDKQFDDAVKFVGTVDFFKTENFAPFFETVIRYLGGLLSAYALSGEKIFLTKADELGKGLMPVFNTPSGLPEYGVNPKSGQVRGGWAGWSVWSESMSCQLEYKYLAHLTGKHDYYNKVEHLMDLMYKYDATDGYPTMWDKTSGEPRNNVFSIGSAADSGYEYFLKQWLLSAKSEPKMLELYMKSANLIIDKLLFITPTRHLLYVTDTNGGNPSHQFEHLSCFLPGMFALGVKTLNLSPRDKEIHLWAAQGLTHTCYLTYADQATGLSPDITEMNHYPDWRDGRWMKHIEQWEKEGRPGGVPPGLAEATIEPNESRKDYKPRRNDYLLRPETVESIYLLWRVTGDEKWRNKGWTIFQALDKNARTPFGFAHVHNVFEEKVSHDNAMPSYFLAETLKYLYLLFVDEEIIPLDKFVFNTEAHPLPVFHWTDAEKQAYHIA